jgi:hypothetical protein
MDQGELGRKEQTNTECESMAMSAQKTHMQ